MNALTKAIGCLPLLLMLAGCSDLTATMSGTVFLDNEPMMIGDRQRGVVVFRPVSGGATCTGVVNDKGEYRIATGSSNGLVPGDYLVSVRVIELIDAVIEGAAPSGKPITPQVYADPLTSGLNTLVSSGANRYDIKLESSAGPAVVAPVVVEAEPDSQVEAEPDGQVEAEPDAGSPNENSPAGEESPDQPAIERAPEQEGAADE